MAKATEFFRLLAAIFSALASGLALHVAIQQHIHKAHEQYHADHPDEAAAMREALAHYMGKGKSHE